MSHHRLFVVFFLSCSAAPFVNAQNATPSPSSPAAASPALQQVLPPDSEQAPPTDSSMAVGYNVNTTLPGYLVPDKTLGITCVPFTQVPLAPEGYQGDYWVQEFSDEAARHQLAECEAQPSCPSIKAAENYTPDKFRTTGTIVPEGKIDPLASDVDLRQIRRPAFFGRHPYDEAIAELENRTYTFEFAVPADPYERLNLGITVPDKLRGWYIRGAGVPDGRGHRIPTLMIFIAGRSFETTAVQDPRDPLYTRSAGNGTYPPVK